MFSLCACSGSEKPGDEQIDVSIAEEQTPVEEPVDTIEDTEEPEEEIEEEKIVLSVPEKYLTPLGLDSRFNDWINTDRNVDDFIAIYGMPDTGDEGKYTYTNYSIYFDTETRIATKLDLNLKMGESNLVKTPEKYNPFDLENNLTNLKPLMEIGYYEIQNVEGEDRIIRPSVDLKIDASIEALNEKYKTIFDLENDLGEAYIAGNYTDKGLWNTCIDFTANQYCVMWVNTKYTVMDANKRDAVIPKINATVSMTDNSIVDLSCVYTAFGVDTQKYALSCKTADEYGIEY